MKIEASIGPDGQMVRKIDFQGALLPNGRSVDEILSENEVLKKNVIDLKKEVKESSSILTIIIPNKKIRDIVEVIFIIGTIWGVIVLF